MNTLQELKNLYNVNIPVGEHAEYYFETLSRSQEFDFIPDAIKNINELQTSSGNKLSEIKSASVILMADYITNTKMYKKFLDYDMSLLNIPQKMDARNKWYSECDSTHTFVSIDIAKANYSVLKCLFDTENELKESWDQLCLFHNIHVALKDSKIFRQLVFGKLKTTSRITSFQESIIRELTIELIASGYEKHLVYISHDEIVLAFLKDEKFPLGSLRQITDTFPVPFKFTRFNIERIQKRTRIFIREILDENGITQYKSLFGVPGSQFFYFFKKYVLKSNMIDERDLLFINDGKVVRYVTMPDHDPKDGEILIEF